MNKRNILRLWSVNSWVLLLIGVAFFMLNYFTGLISDDYPYSFVQERCQVSSPSLLRPVKTFGDILYSQYNHYLTIDGRVFDTGLEQWFLSLGNKHYFDVFNALVFVGLIYFLQRLTERKGWKYSIIIAAVYFIFIRSFGNVFLWLSGSFNHLLGGFMNVLFLYLLKRNISSNSYWRGAALMLLSVIAGTIQESFSIGISAALVICISRRLIHKKGVSVVMAMMTIAYFVGMLIILFSPGSWQKAENYGINTASIFVRLGDSLAYVFLGLRIFWLMIVVSIIAMRRQSISLKIFIHDNVFMLLAIGFGLVLLLMLGRAAMPRAFFGVETMSLVLIIKYFPLPSRLFVIITTFALIAIYSFVFKISLSNYKATQAFLAELRNNNDDLVFFDMPHYSNIERHYLGSPLRIDHRSYKYFFESAYFGKKRLMVLPTRCKKELYETSALINPINRCGDNEYTVPEFAFTVIPLPRNKPLPRSHMGMEYVSFPSGNYLLRDKIRVTGISSLIRFHFNINSSTK